MSKDREPPNSVSFSDDFVVASDTAEIYSLQKLIVDRLQAQSYGEEDIFSIKLALEEALINAIRHGNQFDRSKRVRVSLRIDEAEFCVRICDEGCGFDPARVPDPRLKENIERPCGRGIVLMRHYMSEVQFFDNGHTVVMRRRRNGW